MSALLEVTAVTKRYPGVVANDNVSLTVNAGEVVALLGENGAGKSTLLKAVFGLIKPDSGEIKIGSRLALGRGSGLGEVTATSEGLGLGENPLGTTTGEAVGWPHPTKRRSPRSRAVVLITSLRQGSRK